MLNTLFTYWKTFVLVAVLLSASACGQKGDLYLPGEEQASVQIIISTHV